MRRRGGDCPVLVTRAQRAAGAVRGLIATVTFAIFGAIAVLGALAILGAVESAFAGWEAKVHIDRQTTDMATGGDAANDVWLIYSNATMAPFGSIHEDGVRLRAGGGYGSYSYSGRRRGALKSFQASFAMAEALVGYQLRRGPLTGKAFIGIAALDHQIAPADPIAEGGLLAQGLDYGVKGVLELWLNVGSTAWSSLDLSYTTAHNTYAARWRLGYRVLPTISIGPEAIVNGNWLEGPKFNIDGSPRVQLEPAGRLGLFARYEWAGGEVSVSGGLASDSLALGNEVGLQSAYGTINWMSRF